MDADEKRKVTAVLGAVVLHRLLLNGTQSRDAEAIVGEALGIAAEFVRQAEGLG